MFAQTKIRRIQTQYIAVLALQGATSGTGAETWGLWKVDQGPIGVWLRFYQALPKAGNIAPSGWRFDIDDWWLDENGLIMKAPEFPIPAGQYYVTNGEENISLLTVKEADGEGNQAWSSSATCKRLQPEELCGSDCFCGSVYRLTCNYQTYGNKHGIAGIV